MRYIPIIIILLVLCPFATAANNLITGMFILDNQNPTLKLEINNNILEINKHDANGVKDIKSVKISIDGNTNYQDAKLKKEAGTNSKYEYNLNNINGSTIAVIVNDSKTEVKESITYDKSEIKTSPPITGFAASTNLFGNINSIFKKFWNFLFK